MLGKTAFSSAIARAVPPCPLTLLYGVRFLWVVLGARAPDHCCEPWWNSWEPEGKMRMCEQSDFAGGCSGAGSLQNVSGDPHEEEKTEYRGVLSSAISHQAWQGCCVHPRSWWDTPGDLSCHLVSQHGWLKTDGNRCRRDARQGPCVGPMATFVLARTLGCASHPYWTVGTQRTRTKFNFSPHCVPCTSHSAFPQYMLS